MKKEGRIDYDSKNVVMILIISILVVLILIIGSLIYVFLSGGGDGDGDIPPANYMPYYRAYLSKDISLCDDADKKIENRCKINFAHISGNASVCGLLDKSVNFPYLSKVRGLKLNLNAPDYCYVMLSKLKTDNYCYKMESESGKIICMEDLA